MDHINNQNAHTKFNIDPEKDGYFSQKQTG